MALSGERGFGAELRFDGWLEFVLIWALQIQAQAAPQEGIWEIPFTVAGHHHERKSGTADVFTLHLGRRLAPVAGGHRDDHLFVRQSGQLVDFVFTLLEHVSRSLGRSMSPLLSI